MACKLANLQSPHSKKHFIMSRLTPLLKSAEIFKVKDEVAGNGRERFMIEFKKYDFV